MQARLEAADAAINNVVDVTNYVMLEMASRSMAFDLGGIGLPAGDRRAASAAGETLTTLDGRPSAT